MTTIKNEHLLSVYVPEIGTPHSLSIVYPTNLTPEILSTGFIDCNTTSTGNINDGGVESPISGAVGVGLTLSVRITDGEVTNIEKIFNRGTGYTLNEIVEIEYQANGGPNKAKVIVNQVDDGGIVLDVTIIENGDSYSIESGVIDTLQLTNDDGDLVDLKIEISNSDFSRVEVISNPNITPTAFATVGDNLNVVDSLGNVYCEVTVNTISEKISGGIHKYSGEKLVDDVKEIIANEKPPLVTENVDFNSRDSFDPQGDISYDEVEGKLTFHRTAPFNRVLTDDFYIHNDGDTAVGTYNFTDLTADDVAPTEIINIENKDGETLKINSSGVVTQPNVNVPSDDGDLVNKKFIDEFKSDTEEKFQNIENSTDVIRELLEFDAFGNKYSIILVDSPPASLSDGKIYLLTSEVPTERTDADYVQRYVEFSGITKVYIAENNEDGNQVFSDFTIFKNNSELTLNQLKIEYAGGFGRYLIKSDAELLTGGAKFDVEPFRVSDKLISEVDEPPIDGVFREGEVSLLLRVSGVVTYDNNEFVRKKGGDSMEGPLRVTGTRDGDGDNGESTLKVLNVDSGQNGSLNLMHNGNARVYLGDQQMTLVGNLKFNTSGKAIYSGPDKKGFVINDGGVFYDGAYTNDRHVATKKDVEAGDEALRQDIIELEEEINAIAPSVEYGTWEWKAPPGNNTARPPEPGTFFLLDISAFPTISYTEEYGSTTRIKIHNKEYVPDGSSDPVDVHTWNDATPGKLIQLYDAADPDFLLGEIIAKDTSNPDYVYIDVDLIQTSGVPNNNTDQGTGKYLTRINIFEKPISGDASGFVLKTGDTMTGTLNMDGNAAIKTRHLDSGQNSNLELKHNGSTKVYVGNEQTAFQNHIKFNNTGKQVYAGDDKKGLAFYGNGVQYVGDYNADNHVATKKNVDEAIYHNPSDTSTNKYVARSGDTMTGRLLMDEANIQLNAVDPNKSYIDFRRPAGTFITAINFAHNNTTPSVVGGYDINIAGFTNYNRLRLTGRNSASNPLMFEARADGTMGFFYSVGFNKKSLLNVGNIQIETDGFIKHNENERIKFQSRTTANAGDGLVQFERPPSDGRRGIAIRGKHPDDNLETDILWTYTNASGGDAVNYDGKMSSDTNLVNKGYVDNLLDFSTYPELS